MALRVLRDTRRPAFGRLARWRAAAMIGVYLLIVGHIVQWRLTGRTVSPLVGSDAMYTLERGEINGGFLLLCATLLVTVVAGRFLCGWACHMGGLQDGCVWVLRKCGVRPRLFRSRLLAVTPTALGLYMFVWPMVRREAVGPALEAWWPGGKAWLGETAGFPGFSNHLMTEDLWAKLPGWAVAIPFLRVCGCAAVYFLGARGFCRYGCPYGGVMAPLERLAPGRIVVDSGLCDGCGLCTAACDSGVRVLDEVRAHGRVVSAGCVKALDCVDSCPHGALSWGWAWPSIARRRGADPARAYDLSWGEEVAVAAVFAGSLAALRGAYGVVPLLMAVGLAGCAAMVGWKAIELVRRPDVRFERWQLKRAGAWRMAGAVFLALAAFGAAVVVQSGAVKAAIWRAGAIEDGVTVGRETVFAGDRAAIPAPEVERARRALRWYSASAPWSDGGWGVTSTPEADTRAAWLNLVIGEYGVAERLLRRAIQRRGVQDGPCADLGRVMVLEGDSARAVGYLRGVCAARAGFGQTRDLLVWLLMREGRATEAEAVLVEAARTAPGDASARARLGRLYLQLSRVPEALRELQPAAAAAPTDSAIRRDLALARFLSGDVAGALDELRMGTERDPRAATGLRELGARMLEDAGLPADAARWRSQRK